MIFPAHQCWFLTGPTASGKTTVGLCLAELLSAEIISLDSMAVYRDMDIGTAKPTSRQRQRVAHHLIDIVDPREDFSLSSYLELACKAYDQIRARGKQVLLVGGTPLYLKALLRGVESGPPPDWGFRRQVLEEAQRTSYEALHKRLELVDPLSAAKLHPHDIRRIIRALEVHRATGQPISHSQLHFDQVQASTRVFALDLPRSQLHARIEQRTERMAAAGLFDEAQRLRNKYGQLGRTASQAVGYREAFAYLDGTMDRPQALHRMTTRTRQFARRQLTWFRALQECRAIPLGGFTTPQEVAQAILRAAGSESRV